MKKIFKFFKNLFKKLFGGNSGSGGSSSGGSSSGGKELKVEFAYGGVNFNKAKEDAGAQIKDLSVNSSGLKYSWKSGNLKGWGLQDGDPGALAIFAVKDSSGKYRGGKFEWISKSRTTRAFTNIKGGYGGWPKNAVETAKGYAFCICSADAKKRTNWITCDKRDVEEQFEIDNEVLLRMCEE